MASLNDANLSMSPFPTCTSTNSKKVQRRQCVQTLLEQFSDFAHGLHDANEQDVTELEAMVRLLIHEEMRERSEATKTLERRCDVLETALAGLEKGQEETSLVKKRVESLEEMFGSWGEQQSRQAEALLQAQANFGKDLTALGQMQEWQKEALQQLEEKASNVETLLESLTSKTDQSRENLEKRCAIFEASLPELEKGMESSTAQFHADLTGEIKKLSQQVAERFAEANDIAVQQKEWLCGQDERVNQLMSQHESHIVDFRTVQDDQAKQFSDLAASLKQVQGGMGELAGANELAVMKEEVEQISGLLAVVQRAWQPLPPRSQKLREVEAVSPRAEEGSSKKPVKDEPKQLAFVRRLGGC